MQSSLYRRTENPTLTKNNHDHRHHHRHHLTFFQNQKVRKRNISAKTDARARDERDVATELFRAIGESAAQKLSKDFEELIYEPIIKGRPEKLTDTREVEKLKDDDSKYCSVYLEKDGDTNNVACEEVRMHYKEQMPPQGSFSKGTNVKPGSAIVFLHGANGSTFSFRRVLPLVAARLGIRTIAVDRPPYGLTSRPMKDDYAYTKEGSAKLIFLFLEKMNIENVILVGHSAGTNCALEMVLKKNEFKRMNKINIAGLMFISPAIFVPPPAVNRGKTEQEQRKKKKGISPERILKLFWFRTLISSDDYGLNLVRSFTRKNANQVQLGEGQYKTMSTQAREAYTRPLAAENWDYGLLKQFRASMSNINAFGDDASLEKQCENLKDEINFIDITCGENDQTTPINKAKDLFETLKSIKSDNNSTSSSSSSSSSSFDVTFEALEDSAHIPMEETGKSRDDFENYVVRVLEKRVMENFIVRF
jgi:pimeloyl-ACP methyl ester carboxylesterase